MYAYMYFCLVEDSKKKSRAPKATSTQIEFLLTYMEDHNAFATNKLLKAKEKTAYDAQWQKLTEKLNCLNIYINVSHFVKNDI